MKHSIFGICSAFMMMLLVGCMNDLHYSTDPNHRLSFSVDTLSFDTLFTKTSSATRWLKVYNRNSKPLLIEHIGLKGESKAKFRLNVDGQSGVEFSQVEVLGRDSVSIAIEVTVDLLQLNAPTWVGDKLRFQLNGTEQEVVLAATGWDAYQFRGLTLDRDTTFTSEKPIVIYDSLLIRKESRLTIEAGSQIFFHKGAYTEVFGSIDSRGTSSRPVCFRGDRLDDLLPGIPYDREPGSWYGIVFRNESCNNNMEWTVVRSTVNGITIDSTGSVSPKLIMKNCLVQNATENCFTAFNGVTELYGCEFSNGGLVTMFLCGGNHTIEHCTIANYGWWGTKDTKALYLLNSLPKGEALYDYPMSNAKFRNCVIYGKQTEEIAYVIGFNNVVSEADFIYSFSHSLIKGKAIAQDKYVNIEWSKDPQFMAVGQDKYFFDFRLSKDSPAIGKGETVYPSLSPFDFYGNERPQNRQPDAGAFQYIAPIQP